MMYFLNYFCFSGEGNSKYKCIQDAFEQYKNCLIESREDLECLIEEIKASLAKINSENSRTKEAKISCWDGGFVIYDGESVDYGHILSIYYQPVEYRFGFDETTNQRMLKKGDDL